LAAVAGLITALQKYGRFNQPRLPQLQFKIAWYTWGPLEAT